MRLRLVTYLAPSIPLELYRALCDYLAARLGIETTLVSDPRRSGPSVGDDPFARDQADVGFMCAPCFVSLAEQRPAAVVLANAAPLYDDPRCAGRPVYFSEVVARRETPAVGLAELQGAGWAYNDRLSLSGYHAVLGAARRLGLEPHDFGDAVHVGSHLAALDAVAAGRVAFASIDSNTLAIARQRQPERVARLRVLETLGPHPVQPVAVRAGLSASLRASLTEALLAAHHDPRIARVFARNRVLRFVGIRAADYTRATVFGAAGSSFGSGPEHPVYR